MKTLLLESVAGIAGDMFCAAFLDAGLVDRDAIEAIPSALGLDDAEVCISARITASMQATHVTVKTTLGADDHVVLQPQHDRNHHNHNAGHGHSTYAAIDRMLATSALDEGVKDFAREVFRLLAEAEAEAHGMAVADVHFHEVGSVDSIIDVAMAGLCVTSVSPDRVLATPVKLGRGMVAIQHGVHAVPPPASARLARGFRIATVPDAITMPDVELSTPTGLAILRALSPTFVDGWPEGVVLGHGSGGGTMDLGHYANVFRVVLLECDGSPGEDPSQAQPYASDTVVEICFNVDDDSPERIAWTADELRAMNSLDVWVAQVIGKKGRPAFLLSVLAEAGERASFVDWILRHTSTFGVRYRTWDRMILQRESESRTVGGRDVSFKIGRNRSGVFLKEKPEFDDLRRAWSDDPDFRA